MLPRPLRSLIRPVRSGGVSRRGFLLGAAATTAGFAVGFSPLAGKAADGAAEAGNAATPNPFEAYVTIAEDGAVTILSSQFDMGQGSYHGIATLVVEELDADWDAITVVGATGAPSLYGNLAWGGAAQGTGGSTTIFTSWDRYRTAGATARRMLVDAAAEAWSVPASEITVSKGVISHAGSGRSSGFGAFAKAAAGRPVPAEVTLKTPDQWTVIGNPDVHRYDAKGKTTGEQQFTIDVTLPDMLTAVMIHPPRFGATVASFDATQAKSMPGVVDVVAIPRGIAVVGKDMWSALKGRDGVTVTWDESKAEMRGSAELMAEYRDQATKAPQVMAREDGDAAGVLASAGKVFESTFEFPYLAHAAMEPLNAVARKGEDGTVEVWAGHQMPTVYQYLISETAGVAPDKVQLHIMKTGGSFGRRAVADGDVIVEAVAIAKALDWKAPVKVQWTRENDMRGGRYRPAYVHHMRAAVGDDGLPVAWEHHIVGQSIVGGTPFAGMIQHGVDPTSVEGASNLPYTVPNLSVGLTTTEVGVPVLWWRSVGSTHTAYATEVFLDELAASTGADPVDLRLGLLKDHPRHAGVLKLAAEKADWGTAPPEGRFRGISVHESFHSYVAQVVEISMDGGMPKVHKVVVAVDVGIPVNPDTIKAQVEGGVGFALGAVLQEAVTLNEGKVESANYDTYRPLRLNQMPEIEVHIVPSTEPPTGIGEPGVPPLGPALANAVAAATGRRVRVLPFEQGLSA